MENKTVDEVAKAYVENHPDHEVRRMYGHHVRSYKDGYNAASQQCLEKQKELDLKSVAVLNLLRQNESQQAEIDRLKEEPDRFVKWLMDTHQIGHMPELLEKYKALNANLTTK